MNSERKLQWFGTVRGRIGYLATPDLLLYGTAGLAYGRTSASGSILLSDPSGQGVSITNATSFIIFHCEAQAPVVSTCYAGSGSRTSAGWAAGGGFEFRVFGNVTAKLEYLHVDLRGQTITLASPSPPSSPGVGMAYSFDHQTVDIVRAGLNWRVDWGKAPVAVMAKY